MLGTSRVAVALTAAVTFAFPAVAISQEGEAVLELRGFAINLTGIGSGHSGDLEIRIDQWTPAGEVERLRRALAEGGAAGLGRALEDAPIVGVAHVQRGGDLALRFARESAREDGGRRILLATESVVAGSGRGAYGVDYLVVEIQLGSDGGEGRTAPPDQLSWDEDAGALVIERYQTQPVWITELEVVPTSEPD